MASSDVAEALKRLRNEALKNTSIFRPDFGPSNNNLREAKLFTRVHIRATPQVVNTAIETTPHLSKAFCLIHLSDVLIFDKVKEDHSIHVKSALQMLKDKGLELDSELCVYDKPNWEDAGFDIELHARCRSTAFFVRLKEHLADWELIFEEIKASAGI